MALEFMVLPLRLQVEPPSEKLHVQGTIRVNRKIMADDPNGLELATDEGTTRLFLRDNGNVGIGTISPSAKLEVNGTITASGGNSANWNKAYSWGNHTGQGYLTSEVDPQVGTISTNRVPKWNGSALVTGTIQDNGNVGIGVTFPLEKLHVQDNGYLQAIFQSNNDAAGIALKSSGGQQYEMQSLNNGKFFIYDRNNTRHSITIDSIGRVGIGTQSPATNLTVPGLGSTSSYNYLRYNTANGAIYYYSSSEKYKDDIQPLKEDFHKILKAEPKSFIDKVSGERNVGYIAEEFEQLGLNNLVIYKDGEPDALKYELVSLYLLEVVKENTRTAERLKAENESLKGQFENMEARLAVMEAAVARLSTLKESAL
jgi:hypothetical protein